MRKPDPPNAIHNGLSRKAKSLSWPCCRPNEETNVSDKQEKYLECQDCGKSDETVHETTCPYAEEINDDYVEVTLCDDCYNERCMEI